MKVYLIKTITVRGDIAKGIIIANCRAAEKALKGGAK